MTTYQQQIVHSRRRNGKGSLGSGLSLYVGIIGEEFKYAFLIEFKLAAKRKLLFAPQMSDHFGYILGGINLYVTGNGALCGVFKGDDDLLYTQPAGTQQHRQNAVDGAQFAA